MANIKSQIKRNRQNDKRHDRNTTVRSALKTSTKKVQTAVGEGDAETAIARQREAGRGTWSDSPRRYASSVAIAIRSISWRSLLVWIVPILAFAWLAVAARAG